MSDAIRDLAELLARLPGVGKRTAVRLTFHLLKSQKEYLNHLGDAISSLKDKVKPCSVCRTLSEADPCAVCSDERRNRGQICVVSSVQDQWALEESGTYRGLYHVLHGLFSPLDGIGPDDLKMDLLFERVKNERPDEVIVAVRPSVEGEATASRAADPIFLESKNHPHRLGHFLWRRAGIRGPHDPGPRHRRKAGDGMNKVIVFECGSYSPFEKGGKGDFVKDERSGGMKSPRPPLKKGGVQARFSMCYGILVLFLCVAFITSCGPVPRPKDAYSSGPDILRDLKKQTESVKSFRITGRVDHFGEKHRIQGKAYLFSVLPKKLRIELISPFESPLNVLTVNDTVFAMHDVKEARFLTGPADPCNIARLIQIPMPVDDVIRILLGYAPIIDGRTEVKWDTKGFYRVTISDGARTERLEIGPDKSSLPLQRATLEDKDGLIFDITYNRRRPVQAVSIPGEIRVKMQREKVDLLLRYDPEGVELNVDLPTDAWDQTPPAGITVEQVTCDKP
jgi:recombination protein RecR